MDPAETMLWDKDTSFAFMRGARALGHRCLHCLPAALSSRGTELAARARSIEVQDVEPHVLLGKGASYDVASLDAVFIRKDPPFDSAYAYMTQQLDLVADRTFVFNSPRGLRDANEKLFALNFSQHTPRTLVSSSPGELLGFLEEIGGSGVLKPLDGAGGLGVVSLTRGDRNTRALVDLLTLEGKRLALLQEFIPEVTQGDKRVLLLDGHPLGAIRRVPRSDDIRANIHVGGRVEATELTAGEQAVIANVAPKLREHGLWFVGLDLIGERIIEVNVTSPTGVQQLALHLGRPVEQDVIRWVEQRSLELRRTK